MLFINQMEINENFKLVDNYFNATPPNSTVNVNVISSQNDANDIDDGIDAAAEKFSICNKKHIENHFEYALQQQQHKANKAAAFKKLNGIINASLNNTPILRKKQFNNSNSNSNSSNSTSLLNYCEEQIKENDEYKRSALRRAISVKVPSTGPSKIKITNETNSNTSSTSTTNGNGKNEKKVVRFADALGLDLVSVKMIFNPDSPPRIPKQVLKCLRDASRLNFKNTINNNNNNNNSSNNGLLINGNSRSNNESDSSDDYDDDDENSDLDYDDDCYYQLQANNNRLFDSKLNLFNLKPLLNNSNNNLKNNITNVNDKRHKLHHHHHYKFQHDNDVFQINGCNLKLKWKQLFEQPSIKPDFYIKLNEKKVLVETLYTKSVIISGIIRVMNMCFNKRVSIRYTIDKWKTFNNVDASYINNSCDGLTDRFNFNLNLEPFLIQNFSNYDCNSSSSNAINNENPNDINEKLFQLEFAVCYETMPNEYETHSYWDNNSGINYLVDCLTVKENDSITLPNCIDGGLACDNENVLNSNNTNLKTTHSIALVLNNDEICNLSDKLSAAFA